MLILEEIGKGLFIENSVEEGPRMKNTFLRVILISG